METAKLGSFAGDAKAILDAGKQLGESAFRLVEIQGVPATILQDGYGIMLRPELLPRPKRATGIVKLDSLESFCRFFNRHAPQYPNQSIILVDSDPKGTRGATFKAILNYHGAGEGEAPGHGDFVAVYTAQLSVEWMRWMEKSGKTLLHAAFVEHLEDVMDVIVEPPGADLLKLIGSLTGTKNARFDNASNLHDGSMKLNYEEDVTLRGADTPATKPGEITVPAEITSAVPPFEYGPKYKVRNRIRYRIQNRQLSFSYEAVDPHLIIQDAVKHQIKEVAEITKTEPFQGKV